LNYDRLYGDITVELGSGNVQTHGQHDDLGWQITLAETGLDTMTGARVKRVEKYIDGDSFILTYGDGVADIDINKLVEFHASTNKIGTVTGVSPISHYGEMGISGDQVVSFREKPDLPESYINGGYFVFNRSFFDYLDEESGCILERAPLEKLTNDGQLAVYTHNGFWQCMDTYRDHVFLNELWEKGDAKWKVW